MSIRKGNIIISGNSGSGGASIPDNVTTRLNTNNATEVMGIYTSQNNARKIWEGTKAQYNALSVKYDDTYYYITDEGISYDDISDKPTIPTKTSDLTNDSGFIDSNNVYYGTCSTSAGTAAKVVSVSDPSWELRVGNIIGVKFTNTNTASNVTINVNNSGAKSIYCGTAVYTGSSSSYCGYANRINYYMYNGTNWCWISHGQESEGGIYTTAFCPTAANTAAKVASMTSYTATSKRYVFINMQYANSTAAALTLNINSTGAKPIYINGTKSSSSNYTLPAGSYIIYYDGTNYYFRTDGYMGEIVVSTSTPSTSGPQKIWINPNGSRPRDLPTGGTAGQVLKKSSSTNYDVAWVSLVDLLYPVGSIYMTTSETNPGTVLGGTWTKIEGKFIVGANSDMAAGTSGGSNSHAHSTGSVTLTESQIPNHSHVVTTRTTSYGSGSQSGWRCLSWDGTSSDWAQTIWSGGTGGGGSHNHGDTSTVTTLPPYYAAYIWRRTA